MISLAHWTFRYAVDRAKVAFYEWTHPRAPWLARQAAAFLEKALRPEQVGFEWGSGRSTLWFAERIGRLTSVEHDAAWFKKVQEKL